MAMEYEIELCDDQDACDGAKYNVMIDGECFETWVTHNPHKVETWVIETEQLQHHRLHRLIVSLAIESNILQLSVATRCLIYQFQDQGQLPKALQDFLKDPRYTFVGVEIEKDKEKLLRDHSLELTKTLDLCEEAAVEMTDPGLRTAGLEKLAKVILGKDVDRVELLKVRMEKVNLGEVDVLSKGWVLHACIDAHLSFEIGRQLMYGYGPLTGFRVWYI